MKYSEYSHSYTVLATADLPTRIIVIIGLILFILIALFKAWNRSELREWSSWVFPSIAILILIPTGIMEARWQSDESFGTKIVQAVSGKQQGYLHCQRLTEAMIDGNGFAAGEVWTSSPDRAIMKYRECQTFMGLMDQQAFGGGKQPNIEEVTAIAIIVHESTHVSGDYSESSTECKTKQKLASVLVKYFGVSQQYALAMSKVYREQISAYMPSQYQDPTCKVDDAIVPL